MQSLFMVGSIDYQYNDEIYYKGDAEGTNPIKLFRVRENAEAELLIHTRKVIKGFSDWYHLGSFGYGWDEIIRDEKVFEDVLAKYGHPVDLESHEELPFKLTTVVEKMTDEDFQIFLNSLTVEFFKIYEVELEPLDTETRRLLGDKPVNNIDGK